MSQVRLPPIPALTQLGVPGVPGLRLDTLSSSPGLHPSARGVRSVDSPDWFDSGVWPALLE